MIEKEIKFDDAVTVKVIGAEDVERTKSNPSLCSSCQQEKEIVFTKDNARFCKECWKIARYYINSVVVCQCEVS